MIALPLAEPAPLGDGQAPLSIAACEAPLYHLSRAIQAHGLFLALERGSLRVVRASANAGPALGVATTDLLGTLLAPLLTEASARSLARCVDALYDEAGGPPRRSLAIDLAAGPSCAAFLYRGGALACLEIEPPGGPAALDHPPPLSPWVFDLVDRIARSEVPPEQLADIACQAIRTMTGFDRVYFCKFERDGHGHVQGESRGDILPSLMDHHFPATDLPQAARRIYVVNPFRLIPDVDAEDVAIIGGDATPLDLTHSSCRAVARTHLNYLRNMGVKASMSFSLVGEGRLRALLGGHHHAPRPLSFRQLALCRHLVELFGVRLEALRLRDNRALLERRALALQDLAEKFRHDPLGLGDFVAANHDAFCALVDADDVICRVEGRSFPGRLLAPRDAAFLLDRMGERTAAGAEFLQTDNLSAEDPAHLRLCPAVAGALAVPLGVAGGDLIAWLRRETVVSRTWAGDPQQKLPTDGGGALGPRRSFLAYAKEKTGTSRPWSSASAGLARQLRATFSHVLAERYAIGMRKAAEEAATLKTEFMSNVSHELRSPMHAIIGFSELLLKNDATMAPDKRRRFLGTVIDSSRRLLHLIDDLLLLSRLDAGRMTVAFQDGDPLTPIAAAAAEVDALAQAKGIDIRIRDHRRHLRARFDPDRVRQVMVNLLSNALKFSPPGSAITIALETVPPGAEPARMVVAVSDAGIGIPPDELDAIFDKFVQSSRTRSGAGGTGLGLAICRELMTAHGGRIWAANNPEGGASLFIELPHAPVATTGSDP